MFTLGSRRSGGTTSFLVAIMVLVGSLISVIGQEKPWPIILPHELSSHDVATRIRVDPATIAAVSTDFGRLTRAAPAAVFCPSSDRDIAALVRFAYVDLPLRLAVAPRGNGHSVWGQASARNGIVIDMRSLSSSSSGAATDGDEGGALPVSGTPRISVSGAGGYVDAGGEQLWVEVLNETLKRGVAPRSWTDYLYLTVGGTLSNAGVSGQAFHHGPQISNVYELDVVTGKGDMVTCSREVNPDLFYGVLGGLGQFGVITRARIALEPAPQRVRWVRLFYTDFTAFTEDQELLISLDRGGRDPGSKKGFDYVEGSVYMDRSPISNWRSSFFLEVDSRRIASLAAQHGIVYCIEGSMYYGGLASAPTVEQDVDLLLEDLSFVPGFVFTNDVSYVNFLDRVHQGELAMREKGLWGVPHPWLNVFIPKSRILDFDAGVFRGIIKHNHTMGPILIYPLQKDKWDDRMSSVIPDEDVFYTVSLLWSATDDGWEQVVNLNAQVLRYCDQTGIRAKQYLPHYNTRSDWMKHFGHKWDTFLERKRKYDPRALLSPGQGIFTSPLV
uniref:cytokinin dehydrogenase n=1 Tax=Anthurium amnicola TaxID=1678845 RepID=A0A1D1YFU6_9ARAE